jgi:hypothetical protein
MSPRSRESMKEVYTSDDVFTLRIGFNLCPPIDRVARGHPFGGSR